MNRIKKRFKSEDEVVEQLSRFRPSIDALQELRAEIHAVLQKVLRETALGLYPVDPLQLLHAGRRRVAASMDDSTLNTDRKMLGWEQYLIPPLGQSLLTGDLLRVRCGHPENPASYRLVLTPSCDMVAERCEPTLLVARCEKVTTLAQKLGLSANKAEKSAEALTSKLLTAGSLNGFVPLPSFPGHIPPMVAKLKNLQVRASSDEFCWSTHDLIRARRLNRQRISRA